MVEYPSILSGFTCMDCEVYGATSRASRRLSSGSAEVRDGITIEDVGEIFCMTSINRLA